MDPAPQDVTRTRWNTIQDASNAKMQAMQQYRAVIDSHRQNDQALSRAPSQQIAEQVSILKEVQ
jgi:hypothetical protein